MSPRPQQFVLELSQAEGVAQLPASLLLPTPGPSQAQHGLELSQDFGGYCVFICLSALVLEANDTSISHGLLVLQECAPHPLKGHLTNQRGFRGTWLRRDGKCPEPSKAGGNPASHRVSCPSDNYVEPQSSPICIQPSVWRKRTGAFQGLSFPQPLNLEETYTAVAQEGTGMGKQGRLG